jgi:hypothetical protein
VPQDTKAISLDELMDEVMVIHVQQTVRGRGPLVDGAMREPRWDTTDLAAAALLHLCTVIMQGPHRHASLCDAVHHSTELRQPPTALLPSSSATTATGARMMSSWRAGMACMPWPHPP